MLKVKMHKTFTHAENSFRLIPVRLDIQPIEEIVRIAGKRIMHQHITNAHDMPPCGRISGWR
ncbi:MAG TPA: hypothetical protein DCL60_01670 [Armatimonadetes bacterium]|nr:hypothetical protein [Armatimonadota bacterium]